MNGDWNWLFEDGGLSAVTGLPPMDSGEALAQVRRQRGEAGVARGQGGSRSGNPVPARQHQTQAGDDDGGFGGWRLEA